MLPEEFFKEWGSVCRTKVVKDCHYTYEDMLDFAKKYHEKEMEGKTIMIIKKEKVVSREDRIDYCQCAWPELMGDKKYCLGCNYPTDPETYEDDTYI